MGPSGAVVIACSTHPALARKSLAPVFVIRDEIDVSTRTRAGTTPRSGRPLLVLEHDVKRMQRRWEPRAVYLAKGPRPLCLDAFPFGSTKAIDTPAEVASVASGVDTSVGACTFPAPHSQWSSHHPVVRGRIAYFIDGALQLVRHFRDWALEGLAKYLV